MSGTNEIERQIEEILTPGDRYLHVIDRLVCDVHTSYQRIRIADTAAYGRKLFLDDIVQSAEADEFIYHEALTQPALLAAPAPPCNVLILGGGEGATLREVLRWPSVRRVVMVDIDAQVVALCREHMRVMHQGAYDDPRAEVVIADAVDYIQSATGECWDAIISDITEPVDDGPSNFCFTREYFARLRTLLAPGAVLVTQSGPVAPPLITQHARVTRTLQAAFPHVLSYSAAIPSYSMPWGFTLASEAPLDARFDPERTAPLLSGPLGGALRFLDAPFLHAMLTAPAYVRAALESETRIYTDADLPKWQAKQN
jgi:spermidine synthase